MSRQNTVITDPSALVNILDAVNAFQTAHLKSYFNTQSVGSQVDVSASGALSLNLSVLQANSQIEIVGKLIANTVLTCATAITKMFRIRNSVNYNGFTLSFVVGTAPNSTTFVLGPNVPDQFVCFSDLTALDTGYQLLTGANALTGFAFQQPNGAADLVINPAGTIAAGTITFPQAPKDGDNFTVRSSQTVTALTCTPGAGQTINGAPTTIAINTGFTYKYVLSLLTWFKR